MHQIANAWYITVHKGSITVLILISCIVPLSLMHHLNTMKEPFEYDEGTMHI